MIRYYWKGKRYNVTTQTYGTEVTLHPVYGDKLSIKHSMPDNERYYKESFSGTLKFVREDYSWIMNAVDGVTRFNTIYELYLHAVDGSTDTLVTTLKFVITDCEVDQDNGIITVKPSSKTRYDAVLDGLDREFNLVDLNPAIETVQWSKRAILQFTEEGSDVVTNCCGNVTWEQDKTDASGSLTDTFKFGLCDQFIIATVSDIGEGIYYGHSVPEGEDMRDFDIQRGVKNPASIYGYKLRFLEVTVGDITMYKVQLYQSPLPGSTNYTLFAESAYQQNARIPESKSGLYLYNSNNQHVSTVSWSTSKLYARVLCDRSAGGVDARPSSDIVTNDNKYRYVKPYTNNIATITNNGSLTPTPYGQYASYWYSGYYAPPAPVGYVPVLNSFWSNGISTWVDLSLMPDLTLNNRMMPLRHAYPLWSAIKVLLAEIDPNINFGESTDFSEFLFDYNNKTHPIVEYMPHLFITPKTNILKGDYKTPAYDAPIKLKDIFDMLKAVYKCYWYIDDSNNLRIEHVGWFMNGGTYDTPNPVVSYDLTALNNPRNSKAWAYETNKYTFDKPNMPATYTFAWMDDVTQEFKGYQMEMQSQLVEKGKNEEISVGKFTSDIDYVNINPNDISKDGFMMLGALYYHEVYVVPWYNYELPNSNITLSMQNGFLAFAYLEKTAIWLDNLPEGNVNYADGTTASVTKQNRMRQQDVVVPMTSPVFDPTTLIRTGLGEGEVKEIDINLSSLTAKAKLKYDTQ